MVIAISGRLQSTVVGVITVDESMMLMRLKQILSFISLLAAYAPTETCELEEKEMFYVKTDLVID